MSTAQYLEPVPATKEQWEVLAKAAGLNNMCLSDCESLTMDAKVTYEHFLLFRTVISKKKASEFDPAAFGLKEKVDSAKQLVQASSDFQSYINAIKMDTFDEQGAFAGMRKTQKEVLADPYCDANKVKYDDEDEITAKDPLTEKPETYDGKTRGFVAKPHGVLQNEETGQIRAICDTSFAAPDLNIDIREASQIVAWIKQHPGPKYQRILIAQHAAEFYVTIAVYDDDWLDYLDRSQPELKSVMTMHRFGPWHMDNWRDMEEYAAINIALSL